MTSVEPSSSVLCPSLQDLQEAKTMLQAHLTFRQATYVSQSEGERIQSDAELVNLFYMFDIALNHFLPFVPPSLRYAIVQKKSLLQEAFTIFLDRKSDAQTQSFFELPEQVFQLLRDWLAHHPLRSLPGSLLNSSRRWLAAKSRYHAEREAGPGKLGPHAWSPMSSCESLTALSSSCQESPVAQRVSRAASPLDVKSGVPTPVFGERPGSPGSPPPPPLFSQSASRSRASLASSSHGSLIDRQSLPMSVLKEQFEQRSNSADSPGQLSMTPTNMSIPNSIQSRKESLFQSTTPTQEKFIASDPDIKVALQSQRVASVLRDVHSKSGELSQSLQLDDDRGSEPASLKEAPLMHKRMLQLEDKLSLLDLESMQGQTATATALDFYARLDEAKESPFLADIRTHGCYDAEARTLYERAFGYLKDMPYDLVAIPSESSHSKNELQLLFDFDADFYHVYQICYGHYAETFNYDVDMGPEPAHPVDSKQSSPLSLLSPMSVVSDLAKASFSPQSLQTHPSDSEPLFGGDSGPSSPAALLATDADSPLFDKSYSLVAPVSESSFWPLNQSELYIYFQKCQSRSYTRLGYEWSEFVRHIDTQFEMLTPALSKLLRLGPQLIDVLHHRADEAAKPLSKPASSKTAAGTDTIRGPSKSQGKWWWPFRKNKNASKKKTALTASLKGLDNHSQSSLYSLKASLEDLLDHVYDNPRMKSWIQLERGQGESTGAPDEIALLILIPLSGAPFEPRIEALYEPLYFDRLDLSPKSQVVSRYHLLFSYLGETGFCMEEKSPDCVTFLNGHQVPASTLKQADRERDPGHASARTKSMEALSASTGSLLLAGSSYRAAFAATSKTSLYPGYGSRASLGNLSRASLFPQQKDAQWRRSLLQGVDIVQMGMSAAGTTRARSTNEPSRYASVPFLALTRTFSRAALHHIQAFLEAEAESLAVAQEGESRGTPRSIFEWIRPIQAVPDVPVGLPSRFSFFSERVLLESAEAMEAILNTHVKLPAHGRERARWVEQLKSSRTVEWHSHLLAAQGRYEKERGKPLSLAELLAATVSTRPPPRSLARSAAKPLPTLLLPRLAKTSESQAAVAHGNGLSMKRKYSEASLQASTESLSGSEQEQQASDISSGSGSGSSSSSSPVSDTRRASDEAEPVVFGGETWRAMAEHLTNRQSRKRVGRPSRGKVMENNKDDDGDATGSDSVSAGASPGNILIVDPEPATVLEEKRASNLTDDTILDLYLQTSDPLASSSTQREALTGRTMGSLAIATPLPTASPDALEKTLSRGSSVKSTLSIFRLFRRKSNKGSEALPSPLATNELIPAGEEFAPNAFDAPRNKSLKEKISLRAKKQ